MSQMKNEKNLDSVQVSSTDTNSKMTHKICNFWLSEGVEGMLSSGCHNGWGFPKLMPDPCGLDSVLGRAFWFAPAFPLRH